MKPASIRKQRKRVMMREIESYVKSSQSSRVIVFLALHSSHSSPSALSLLPDNILQKLFPLVKQLKTVWQRGGGGGGRRQMGGGNIYFLKSQETWHTAQKQFLHWHKHRGWNDKYKTEKSTRCDFTETPHVTSPYCTTPHHQNHNNNNGINNSASLVSHVN